MSKIKGVLAVFALAVMSVTAGYFTAPEDFRVPVTLANGEVMQQPCCVMVEGECVALVDSEESAKDVMNQIKAEYKNEKTVDVKIREKTSTEGMELKNGDKKPEVLSEDEAAEQMVLTNAVTVETKDVIVEGITEEYKTITNKTEELNLGESRVIQEGEDGFVLVTKEISRENGEATAEKIISKKTLVDAIPEIILQGTAGLSFPLDSLRVTSGFGGRWGRQHEGVDLGMPEGSAIYAAKVGTVTYSGYCGGYGLLIKIDHGGGMETYYAHCSRLLAAEGDTVEAGTVIAEVGSTGNSTGPHLHFEVRINGRAEDPLKWLDAGV